MDKSAWTYGTTTTNGKIKELVEFDGKILIPNYTFRAKDRFHADIYIYVSKS